MELLFNLAWLLLALPACWLWRDRIPSHKFSSRQCLLTLGCMLVVLFPVVSVTDDLRAMQAIMEESPNGRRSLRQKSSDRLQNLKQSPQALVGCATPLVTFAENLRQISIPSLFLPVSPAIERTGRAPPGSFLA